MSKDAKELLVVIGVALLGLALLSGVFVGVEAAKCSQLGETTGRRTEHHALSGCYVEVTGRLIPQDAWRGEQE